MKKILVAIEKMKMNNHTTISVEATSCRVGIGSLSPFDITASVNIMTRGMIKWSEDIIHVRTILHVTALFVTSSLYFQGLHTAMY